MPAEHELTAETVGILLHAVDTHLGELRTQRVLIRRLCRDAVGFARAYHDDHVGRRARNSAALLLEMGCPELDAGLRRELAVICELTAIGAAHRLQH